MERLCGKIDRARNHNGSVSLRSAERDTEHGASFARTMDHAGISSRKFPRTRKAHGTKSLAPARPPLASSLALTSISARLTSTIRYRKSAPFSRCRCSSVCRSCTEMLSGVDRGAGSDACHGADSAG